MFYSEISHRLFVEVESILKSELNDRNITFETQVITTDFELALLKASKWFWPKSTQMGGYVHFSRCQISNLKQLGFIQKKI